MNSIFLLLSLAIPTVSGHFINIPENIEFNINYYNTTNCTVPFKTTTLKTICYNTSYVNKVPKCCYDMLNEISFYPNTSFNNCTATDVPNTEIRGIGYNCNSSDLHGLTTTESLAYFGMASIIIFALVSLVCMAVCLRKMCCEDYSRL